MVLEDSLKELQGLKIGSIDRAASLVPEIIKKDNDVSLQLNAEIEGNLMAYVTAVREKLPQILGNIESLGNIISDADFYYPISESKPGDLSGIGVYPSQFWTFIKWGKVLRSYGKMISKPAFGLRVDINYNSKSQDGSHYEALFLFDKKTNSIANIRFGENTLLERERWAPYKSCDEFVEMIANSTYFGKMRGNYRYESLPFVLNQVPEILPLAAEEGTRNKEKRLRELEVETGKGADELASLKISDF